MTTAKLLGDGNCGLAAVLALISAGLLAMALKQMHFASHNLARIRSVDGQAIRKR